MVVIAEKNIDFPGRPVVKTLSFYHREQGVPPLVRN